MNQSKLSQSISTFAQVLLGNILYALTVKFFLVPGNLVMAGATGISLAVHHVTGFSMSLFLLGFNILALIIGRIALGRSFLLTTIVSSLSYPIALEIFNRIFAGYTLTDDIMLNTIFSGIGIGVSLGIVLRAGSSTGGMDVAPLILNKFCHVPVSIGMYGFDIVVLLAQATMHTAEEMLYGILLICIYTVILDKVLLLGNNKTEIKVISKHYREICDAILDEADRGVTLLSCEGGYLHEQMQMVFSVVSRRELPKVEKLILGIDPDCFLVVTKVSQVSGFGFTKNKRYR